MSLTWGTATGSVYDELTATLSFNDDDTNLVYIDWDDGESNKLSEANYQWKKTPDPSGSLTVKHTYTAAGYFYPIVQSVTSKGFVSRYYSANAGDDKEVTPHSYDTNVSGITINDSTATAIMRVENRTVKSGIDNSIFEVANTMPMRLGDGAIANSWLTRQGMLYVSIPPLMSTTEMDLISPPKLEIEMLVASSTYDNRDPWAGIDIGRSYEYKKLLVAMSGSGSMPWYKYIGDGGVVPLYGPGSPFSNQDTISGSSVQEILSVKYLNPRPATESYDSYNAYNKLKLFILTPDDAALTGDNAGMRDSYYPITYVSPGSPFKKADDSSRYVTLDFSQGRAAASNKSISYYRYDIGKSWFSPIDQWGITTTAFTSGNTFTNTTRTTSPLKTVSYSYLPQSTTEINVATAGDLALGFNKLAAISSGNALAFPYTGDDYEALWFTSGNIGVSGNQAIRTDQFAIDDFGRFYDQYHFVRNSVEPNSSAAYTSSLSGNRVQAAIFKPSLWGDFGSSTASLTNMAFGGTANLSPYLWSNGSGTSINLEGINSRTVYGPTGGAKSTSAYMTILVPKKTNKFFFNFSNYAQGLQYNATSSSNKRLDIGGVYYLNVQNKGTITQNCTWKPLEFEDTTKITKEIRDTTNNTYSVSGASFAKAGYISFNMPSDWDAINWTDICGGVYGTYGAGSPVTWASSSTDIKITGTRDASGTADIYGTTDNYGDWVQLNLGTTSKTALQTALGSGTEGSNRMSSWKYIFYCTSGTASGAAYWIASGANNGWDGTDKLILHFGERGTGTEAVNSPEIANSSVQEGLIRRINSYEVLDGAYKGVSGTANKRIIVPVGLTTTEFDQSSGLYSNNTWNASDTSVTMDPIFPISSAALESGVLDWATDDLYAIKIILDGESATATLSGTNGGAPVLNNLFAANEANTAIIKQVDDSAYSLNTLPLTSDITYSRAGAFYRAITRKGKVFISKTGIEMQEISLSSVALGDTKTATVSGTAESSLYGYLHTVRRLYEENVRVYWDHQQKDGTFVRLWGIITDVQETASAGGPSSVTAYDFNMAIEDIALLDNNGELMTNIFPLGGVLDERDFT